jgi:hypothetical protein
MHYNLSTKLILIAVVVLGIALIVAIIAYKNIKDSGIISNNSPGDLSYVKQVLMFFIVVDSLMLLIALYALAKVRTSNVGGWIGFVIGLILVVLVLIFGIRAIDRIDGVAYPWVLRGLVINVVVIVLSFLLLVLSVFTKPRVCTGNAIKKIYQNMKLRAEECAPVAQCAPQPQCAPAVQPVNVSCAPPQPLPQQANCNYMGSNGQIANYVNNPYIART